MDSDGYCDTWGRCEFTTIKEHLALEISELVASLGFRSVIAKKPAMLNGVDHGPKYDVTFTPDRKVFRLGRKLRRQKATGRFNRFRAIVAVRRVPSVPVRCIEIDGTDGVYLAGRSFIPTHNSSLGRLGLLIHSTAGFVDQQAGDGHITLEFGPRGRRAPHCSRWTSTNPGMEDKAQPRRSHSRVSSARSGLTCDTGIVKLRVEEAVEAQVDRRRLDRRLVERAMTIRRQPAPRESSGRTGSVRRR